MSNVGDRIKALFDEEEEKKEEEKGGEKDVDDLLLAPLGRKARRGPLNYIVGPSAEPFLFAEDVAQKPKRVEPSAVQILKPLVGPDCAVRIVRDQYYCPEINRALGREIRSGDILFDQVSVLSGREPADFLVFVFQDPIKQDGKLTTSLIRPGGLESYSVGFVSQLSIRVLDYETGASMDIVDPLSHSVLLDSLRFELRLNGRYVWRGLVRQLAGVPVSPPTPTARWVIHDWVDGTLSAVRAFELRRSAILSVHLDGETLLLGA